MRLFRAFVDSANNPEERAAPSDLRTFFELGLMVFRNLHNSYEGWRDRVFTGEEEVNEATAQFFQHLFQEWAEAVAASDCELRSRVWDDHDDDVLSLLCAIREAGKQAKEVLDNWESPALASNPTFRTVISAEEAAKIDHLIESGAAQLSVTPKRFEANSQ